MRLEDYLNHHPEMFRFAGAIHDSGAVHEGTVVMSKVLHSLGAEIGENLKHGGASLQHAGQSLAHGAKEKLKGLFHPKK